MSQKYLTESMKKSPTRESQRGLTENRAVVIPARFSQRIDAHMLGNMLDIGHYPLIMAIIGQPGMGKTYQLRKYLEGISPEVRDDTDRHKAVCEKLGYSYGSGVPEWKNPPLEEGRRVNGLQEAKVIRRCS